MDRNSSGEVLRGSSPSVVCKGLNLISYNTELLILISVGFVQLFADVVGYRPFNHLNDLLPPLPDLGDKDDYEDHEIQMIKIKPVDLTNFTLIHRISEAVDTVGTYTTAISLGAHFLLPYAVIMEKQKMLLVPWLVVSLLRSVARELVITVLGIVLCASHSVFYYPCLQYSALQGAQLCFVLYLWTSVHSFYYHLKFMSSIQDFSSVINSIKNTSKDHDIFTPHASAIMDEDDDVTEATLVERAAMAWIAREILETDEEYVTDNQFGQYLAIKATMELRQALKELRGRKTRRSTSRKSLTEEKVQDGLEFIKLSNLRKSISRDQAFDQSKNLSKRDPIRSVPFITKSKSTLAADGRSMISGITRVTGAGLSTMSIDGWSQTVPSTRRMRTLLDILDQQQQLRLRRTKQDKEEEYEDSI